MNQVDCRCNRYLRSDKPTRLDKLAAILGLIGLVCMAMPFVILVVLIKSLPDIVLLLPMDTLTLGEYSYQILSLLGLVILVGGSIFYSITIGDYFRYKKRRTFAKEE